MSFLSDLEDWVEANPPRWTVPVPLVMDSIGGTHQLHRLVGRWGGGETGEWVVLVEKAGGAAVLDMARVKTSTVCWRPDGALLVRVGGCDNARLLLVEPGMASFRDVGIDRADRPLAELQQAVAAVARELGVDGFPAEPRDSYLQRDFSPDGDLIIEYRIHPQRMSHETRVPRLIDAATGETLLDMPNSLYDGTATWRDGSLVTLNLRLYDNGSGGEFADIDWGRRTIAIRGREVPLSQGKSEIERAFRDMRRHGAAVPANPEPRRWGAMTAILLVAILLIGAVSFGSHWFAESPKPVAASPKPIPKPIPTS